MTHFKLIALVGLAAVISVSGLAFAQGMGGQGAPRLGCQDRFDALDINKDGQLTQDEFLTAPHHRGNAEQMFKAMDVNGRGYVTKDEFCSGKGRGKGMGGGMGQGPCKGVNQ